MRVMRLEAENTMRVRAVEIAPAEGVTKIAGRNGQGKTSVLDALWIGLKGKMAMPEKPVRKGAEAGRIRLELGDKGVVELVVKRTFSAKGTHTVEVHSAKEGKLGRPQEALDALIGELAIDPLEFARMPLKDQITMLRKMVKLDVDVDELNAANKVDYDERTAVKKEAKRLEQEAMLITVQPDLPADRVDEKALREKLQNAAELNQEAMVKQNEKAQWKREAEAQETIAANEQRNIKLLETQLEKARKVAERAVADGEKAQKKADAVVVPDGVDVSELNVQLEQAALVNREIVKRERRDEVMERFREQERQANALTRAIEQREEQKRDALAKASSAIPAEGLSFDEATLLYNGVPFSQASWAEQMKVSVSLAMAANPKLRIIRIKEGNLLDQDSLRMIEEMAAQNDYDVWMEWVDASGKVGIVIEDGSVVAVNA